MTALWLLAGLAAVLGGLHLSARVVCSRRGCRWEYEVTNSGIEPIALRCKRCRRWCEG